MSEKLKPIAFELHGTSSNRFDRFGSEGLNPKYSRNGNKLYTVHVGRTLNPDEIQNIIVFVWKYAYEKTYWTPKYSQFSDPEAIPTIAVFESTPRISLLGIPLLKDKSVEERVTRKKISPKRVLGAATLSRKGHENKELSQEEVIELWNQIERLRNGESLPTVDSAKLPLPQIK